MERVDFFGATDEEWAAFIKLAKVDVRPVVSDPHVEKTPKSSLTDPSKTPSVVGRGNYAGQYYGIANWVTKTFKEEEIQYWIKEKAHGICLVGNNYKAFDLDIESESEATAIQTHLESMFGEMPIRKRNGSPRRLLMFRVEPNKDGLNPRIKKQIVKTPNGVVEMLGNSQQFVVAGTHKSGERYYWERGLPKKENIPTVSQQELIDALNFLQEHYSVEGNKIIKLDGSTLVVSARNKDQLVADDHETKYVLESKYFREFLPDGKIAVQCPFEHLHVSSGGKFDGNLSSTVYMPKGLGGLQQSGFKCLHASHGEISLDKFLSAIGYVPEEFALEPIDEETKAIVIPSFMGVNSKTGEVPANTFNICAAVEADQWLGIGVRFDTFSNQVEVKHFHKKQKYWMPLSDNDYTEIAKRLLVPHNFKQPSKEILRSAVFNVATSRAVDSAKEWIDKLNWDGEERINTFATTVLGTTDTEYNHAVMQYLWTALAGRVLSPGVKADMIPVLIGHQGLRKSTFVQSLAPEGKNWTGEINIAVNDDNNARLVQGKVAIELPELKGLTSKAEEYIKAWVTRTEDSWIPKFMEQPVTYPRRFVMIGSTNQERFLSDTTGNRRWLPIRVCQTNKTINIEYLKRNLLQLWAEAKFIFQRDGVKWETAETLGREVAKKHINEDAWSGLIAKWLTHQEFNDIRGEDGVTIDQVLTLALLKNPAQITRADGARVERILSDLGWVKDEDMGTWYSLI